ncbi:D-Ala-D-Ala carboxypeptidase [Spirochaetia bacterium]|nr:D-Ala-D-Ala carboxypeptidase [Spirochaetia bacterium]
MKAFLLFWIALFSFAGTSVFLNAQGVDPLFPAAAPPAVYVRSAVLIDAETGTILFSLNPTLIISPASLTKLMTIHLTLREINARRISTGDIVKLPPESWADNQPPRSSLMFLDRGQRVTLGELLLGLAVSSGNDAAVAAALHAAPSIEAFVAMMNAEAGRLGLSSTRFTEPAGISSENSTTAMDLARFCRVYLQEHPDAPALHSRSSFAYPLADNIQNPRTIVQYNRNSLLGRVNGVDGLKTGHITEAGFNIALSAKRGETRLIAILLGAENEEQRDRDGEALLSWGFENFKTLRFTAIPIPPVRVWGSREKYASLKPGEDLAFTVSVRRAEILRQSIELQDTLKAPISAGGNPASAGTPVSTKVGNLVLSDSMGELRRIPLVLEKEAVRGNFFRVILDGITLFFRNLFRKP